MAKPFYPHVKPGSYMANPRKGYIPFVGRGGYTKQNQMWNPEPDPIWESVTGNPVSFETIKQWPLRQLEVAFSPVQDLHGYDSPWPAGGGVNLFDISTAITNGPISSYGITEISIDSNGKVHIIGTSASSVSSFSLGVIKAGDANAQQLLGKGYTLSTWDVTGGTIYSCWGFRTDTENTFAISMANPGNGVSFDLSFKPMISNGAATAWTPYSNVCPILGWDSLNVEQAQTEWKNVGGYWYAKTDYPTRLSIGELLPIEPNTSYTVTIAGNLRFAVQQYNNTDESQTTNAVLVDSGWRTETYTFTSHQSANYVWLLLSSPNYSFNITPADGYAQGLTMAGVYPTRSISISLGSTVYSGTLDLVTGVVTVDHMSETYNGTEAWGRDPLLYDTARFFLEKNGMKKYENYTSSPYVLLSNRMPTVRNYAEFADTKYLAVTGYSITSNPYNYVYVMSHYAATGIETLDQFKAWLAENPIQVCYELATPLTIQLTPQEVESLAGDNTMWTDGDSLEVTYRRN